MSRALPRYTNTQHTDELKLDRIIGTTTTSTNTSLARAGELRGIPCIARGVTGTQPNTNPLTETIKRNP